jgi:7,8-dihydropterin-6-yl-methyl-4-(beta-D-ribofuranosyl)aminobenzene 5'-phosphate synthase
MKITIIYDNEAFRQELAADWGFSCLVEVSDRKILFDTGAKSDILLANMASLGIAVDDIDEIFISHFHWDHTGGLAALLARRSVPIYVPLSYDPPPGASDVITVKDPLEIHPGIHSTGELGGVEQSLVIRRDGGTVIIAGCSHPGVDLILTAAAQIGEPWALIGGLHDFDRMDVLEPLAHICPTHCTKHKREIRRLYANRLIAGGAGKVIQF